MKELVENQMPGLGVYNGIHRALFLAQTLGCSKNPISKFDKAGSELVRQVDRNDGKEIKCNFVRMFYKF